MPPLFAVHTTVDALIPVSEFEAVREFLLHRGDTAGVLALYDVLYLFWQYKFFFLHDLAILYDVYRDVMVDETQDIKVQHIDVALNLQYVLLSHLVASCILYDSDRTVKLIKI